ncbi:hypothetical protein [uncultured Bradyrhizobium sp.]|uniref:T4 family baseplate hub assembly chaperone n=1 Tax=uncultured Bradyrhizobium sp. TaxID=199684 RepID=UPI0035CB861C
MNALADDALLSLWERGAAVGPVDRALLLLGAALPAQNPEQCAGMPIGARDAAILKLRCATFGGRLSGRANCPHCREEHEFDLAIEELLADSPPPAETEIVLDNGLRFRLPNSRDLAAIAHHNDAEAAIRHLVQRCCVDPPPALVWSPSLLEAADMRIGAADIELRLNCIACGKAWADRLDVAGYVWEEIAERARRLLDDVHGLAAHYGWSERQILSMSEARRDAYLQRCFA